jgi:hypothetical protein
MAAHSDAGRRLPVARDGGITAGHYMQPLEQV